MGGGGMPHNRPSGAAIRKFGPPPKMKLLPTPMNFRTIDQNPLRINFRSFKFGMVYILHACVRSMASRLGHTHLRFHMQMKRFGWRVESHTCRLQLAAQVRTYRNSLSACCFPHLSHSLQVR